MNWIRVSKTRYDCGDWVVRAWAHGRQSARWIAFRRSCRMIDGGPFATPEEAMRAVESAVEEVA